MRVQRRHVGESDCVLDHSKAVIFGRATSLLGGKRCNDKWTLQVARHSLDLSEG